MQARAYANHVHVVITPLLIRAASGAVTDAERYAENMRTPRAVRKTQKEPPCCQPREILRERSGKEQTRKEHERTDAIVCATH